MVKRIAVDWDDHELRVVAAQVNGRSVKVTDALVVPIDPAGLQETLRRIASERGFQNTEALLAIGRGSAELRELQLPKVPDEELPDMVRFQSIRSFANAGDNAVVDFLVTKRSDETLEMIAAAVEPNRLAEIESICQTAQLTPKRIALRPLAAAALYLAKRGQEVGGETVLIDLLADDAEIVVARGDNVVFVRTVRMPTDTAARGRALASELKRSLVASGSSGKIDQVILWGRQSVHADEVDLLAKAAGADVEVIDPFTLVDVDRQTESDMPEHVGRLAPLVGLLVADEQAPERLIDFLNPRQRPEEVVNPYRKIALIGLPVAAALLLAFVVYRQLNALDRQIAELKDQINATRPDVERAQTSMARTELVDQYLDGDVNWLAEMRRMADRMPPADQLIVRGLGASADRRAGGGQLKVEGAATSPEVIDEFEESLRDEDHQVRGSGASDLKTDDAYRWGFTETVTVAAEAIRNQRYERILAKMSESPEETSDLPDQPEGNGEPDSSEASELEQVQTNANQPPAQGNTSDGPQGSENEVQS